MLASPIDFPALLRPSVEYRIRVEDSRREIVPVGDRIQDSAAANIHLRAARRKVDYRKADRRRDFPAGLAVGNKAVDFRQKDLAEALVATREHLDLTRLISSNFFTNFRPYCR